MVTVINGMPIRAKIIVDGLVYPECPRWHQDRLWFSDMHDGYIFSIDGNGKLKAVVDVPGSPAGLGWLPDGVMLVVSMAHRKVYAWNGVNLVLYADLSAFCESLCNEMVVDKDGRAYVGCFGYDLFNNSRRTATNLYFINNSGRVQIVANDLHFPNGMAIQEPNSLLLVAETNASRITGFTIGELGELHARHEWAVIPGTSPDGISLDEEGAIWIASPRTGEILRILAGGTVTHRINWPSRPHACLLGGETGTTLYILSAPTYLPNDAKRLRHGRIEALALDIPARSAFTNLHSS